MSVSGISTQIKTTYSRVFQFTPFLFACLLLSGDIELYPGPANFTVCTGTLSICSFLHALHSAALSDLLLVQSFILNLRLGFSANHFLHHRPFSFLPD